MQNSQNLAQTIIDNFNRIANYFNFETTEYKKYFAGMCPLHDGDNPISFSIYKEGTDDPGSWQCHTHACHKKYGGTAIGLVAGLLSIEKKRQVQIPEAIVWCEEFFKSKFSKPRPKTLFDNVIQASLQSAEIDNGLNITLDTFKKLTTKNYEYFVNRGYKEETLELFNVGYCNNPKKQLYGRILVPHLNTKGNIVVGVAGRSVWEKCKDCGSYHNPGQLCRQFPKWRNNPGFSSTTNLYNYHRASEFIKDTKIAILVEGKPNIWRLEEAGFPMGMACFGNKFSLDQKFLLDKTGASTIIVVPDAGEPGEKFVQNIRTLCKYSHNIVTIDPTYDDDIGKCNVETVKQILGPILEKHYG